MPKKNTAPHTPTRKTPATVNPPMSDADIASGATRTKRTAPKHTPATPATPLAVTVTPAATPATVEVLAPVNGNGITRRAREAYRTAYYHRDAKNPLKISDARDILADIERGRDWYIVPNPGDMSYDAGTNTVSHRGESLGRLSARGYTALAYWARESGPAVFNPHESRTFGEALGVRDWKSGLMVRRVTATADATPLIIGMQTERQYGAMPYPVMLDGFPKDWIIPKLNVDLERLTINVTPPDMILRRPKFKGDDIRVGARIIGSDTGSARAMILDEIIRMVCTNGMIRATFETFFERFHRGATINLAAEWSEKVRAFVAYVPGRVKAEADRIESAMARTFPDDDTATRQLVSMGLSATRAAAAIAYAHAEFHGLNAWSVSQGVTFISQTSARNVNTPASPATQETVDIIGAALFEGATDAAA